MAADRFIGSWVRPGYGRRKMAELRLNDRRSSPAGALR
jgi:hypothetical protein